MNEALLRQFIDENLLLSLSGLFVLSIAVSYYFSKKALIISKRKRLFAEVNHRSSHEDPVPAFGGISFFIVLVATILGIVGLGYSDSISFILLGLFFLFLSGLKDDLIGTSARTKLLVQIATALVVLLNTDFQINHLGGFLGIEALSPTWSLLISVGFIVFFVNAFNLIDGIDGLASLRGMVSLAVFGFLFFLRDHLPLLFISIALFAALFNFLFFNLAPRKKKMFMGDTGSLVVGYILAILAIALIAEQPIRPESGYILQNAVVFLLSVLVIPILDTLRIIVIRLTRGQKPWVADRNHLHHVLLDCGLSHIQATAALVGLQIKAIVIVILINDLGPIALHGYLVCLYLTYSAVFLILSKTTVQKSPTVKKLTWVLRTLLP